MPIYDRLPKMAQSPCGVPQDDPGDVQAETVKRETGGVPEICWRLKTPIGEIERRPARHKQQHGVGLTSLRLVMQRQRSLVEAAGERAIGFLVLLGLDFRFRPLPQRARRIDLPRLALFRHQEDRELDVVGIAADDALDLVGRKAELHGVPVGQGGDCVAGLAEQAMEDPCGDGPPVLGRGSNVVDRLDVPRERLGGAGEQEGAATVIDAALRSALQD